MKHRLSFVTILLMAFTVTLNAQNYDFSAVAPSGHTLYYEISGNDVTVIRPEYQYSNDVIGDLVIPASVTNGSTTYTVTAIGDMAFFEQSYLTSVTIPNSVTSIGNETFNGCSGMTEIIFLATNPPALGDNVFNDVSTDIPVYVPLRQPCVLSSCL